MTYVGRTPIVGMTKDKQTDDTGRHLRRLHNSAPKGSSDNEVPLAQSLSAMTTHLLNSEDESEGLESSSEKDIFLGSPSDDQTNLDYSVETESVSEEYYDTSRDQDDSIKPTSVTWIEKEETNSIVDNEVTIPQLRESLTGSTTPKGLTTWSAIHGDKHIPMYGQGTVERLPSDYSISGMLQFGSSTEAIAETSTARTTEYTTVASRTTKAHVTKSYTKPYTKLKKKVAPSHFVRPTLNNVEAQVIGSDDTHIHYQLKTVTTNAQERTTKKPTTVPSTTTKKAALWPYQVQTKRTTTTAAPVTTRRSTKRPAFSKITGKPDNPYYRRTQPPILTLTTPTTTTPRTTTVYYRTPSNSLIYPMATVSLSNLPFFDFLRSQIIPRIGLSLISLMTTSPLLLSMLGMAMSAGRRKKRDLSSKTEKNVDDLPPRYDLSAIKKKLERMVETKDKNQFKSIQMLSILSEMATRLFNSHYLRDEGNRAESKKSS